MADPYTVDFYGAADKAPNVTSVAIPATVERIDLAFFQRFPNAASVQVGEGNAAYSSHNGMLFDEELTNLLLVPEGMEGAAVLPVSAASVPACVFSRCTKLSAVEFPTGGTDRLPLISWNGILYSKNTDAEDAADGALTLIAAPAGLGASAAIVSECTAIAEGAFAGNRDLLTIVASGAIEAIGVAASASDDGGAAESAEADALPAFAAEAIASATVITSERAAWEAAGFTSFADAAEPGDAIEPIEGSGFAFELQPDMTLSVRWAGSDPAPAALDIPAYGVLDGVRYAVASVAPGAFEGQESIVTVDAPSTLASIGDGAFDGCANLKTAHLPNSVRTIGKRAFAGTALLSLALPTSLDVLGAEALAGINGTDIVALHDVPGVSDTALAGASNVSIYTPARTSGMYSWIIGAPTQSNHLYPYALELPAKTIELASGEEADLFDEGAYKALGEVETNYTYRAQSISVSDEGGISAKQIGNADVKVELAVVLQEVVVSGVKSSDMRLERAALRPMGDAEDAVSTVTIATPVTLASAARSIAVQPASAQPQAAAEAGDPEARAATVNITFNPNGGYWIGSPTPTATEVSEGGAAMASGGTIAPSPTPSTGGDKNPRTSSHAQGSSIEGYLGKHVPYHDGDSNYVFAGWSESSTASSGSKTITVGSSAKTYYAVWEYSLPQYSAKVAPGANNGVACVSSNNQYATWVPSSPSYRPGSKFYVSALPGYDINEKALSTHYPTTSSSYYVEGEYGVIECVFGSESGLWPAVTISLAKKSYNITANKGTGVSALTLSKTSYQIGTSTQTFTVTATANAGYDASKLTLTRVSGPNVTFTNNGTGTVTVNIPANATENLVLSGSLPASASTITANKGTGVSAFTLSKTSYNHISSAQTFTVKATALTGYNASKLTLTRVSGPSVTFTNNGSGTVTVNIPANATGNLTLSGSLAANTYTITANKGTGVSAFTLSKTSYTFSSSAQTFTVKATALTGYNASKLTLSKSSGPSATFTNNGSATVTVNIPANATGNLTLSGSLAANTYTITANKGDGVGSFKLSKSSYTYSASAQALTVSAYSSAEWYDESKLTLSRTSGPSATFANNGAATVTVTIPANATGNLVLSGSLALKEYNIIANKSSGVDEFILSQTTYTYSEEMQEFTVRITALRGYNNLLYLTTADRDISFTNNRTALVTVSIRPYHTGDISFSGMAAENQAAITFEAQPGGTVSPSGTWNVGVVTGSQESEASANSGYKFDGWYDGADRIPIYNTGNGVFVDPVEGKTLYVNGSAAATLTDKTYTAHFSPRTDLGYKIEYYYQGKDGTWPTTATYSTAKSNGTLNESKTISGADVEVSTNAQHPQIPALTANKEIYVRNNGGSGKADVLTATIKADGSTVFKVYYKIKFKIDYTTSDAGKGTVDEGGGWHAYGDQTGEAANVTAKNGYSFTGWSPAHSATALVKAAMTYIAQFKANDYLITLNTAGGSVAGWTQVSPNATYTKGYTIESNTFSLPTPARSGYTFGGWQLNGSGSASTSVSIPKGSTGNKSYTAVWAENMVTLTFTAADSGSTVSPSGPQAPIGAVTGSMSSTATVRTGYTFKGWFSDVAGWIYDTSGSVYVDGTTLHAKGSAASPLVSATYEARTVAKDVTINWNSNGGTDVASGTVKFDGTLSFRWSPLPVPAKTGYTFGGWYASSDLSGSPISPSTKVTSEGPITYYAKWNGNAYRVAFDGNGATSGSTAAMDMIFGIPKNLTPNGFVKAGHTFKGWATSEGSTDVRFADCASVINLSSVEGATVTLYAVWEVNRYTITWDPRSGHWDDGTTTAKTSQHEYGSKASGLDGSTLPTREGYVFDAWTTAPDASSGVREITVVEDASYFAKWEAIIYRIAYDGNSATSGSMASESRRYDEVAPLAKNAFARAGHTFLGWSRNSSATTPEFRDQQEVSGLTAEEGKTVTLFAIWQENEDATYVVEHWVENLEGTFDLTREELPSKTGATVSVVPLEDASFYLDEGDGRNLLSGTVSSDGSLTLKAYYKRYRGSLTYQWGTDTVPADIQLPSDQAVYVCGQTVRVADAPSAEGYTFSGWQGTYGEGIVVPIKSDGTFTMPNSDVTLTGTWTALPAHIVFEANGGEKEDGVDLAGVTGQAIEDTALPDESKVKRVGYKLAGWYADPELAGDALAALPSTFPAGTTTYYAKWVPVMSVTAPVVVPVGVFKSSVGLEPIETSAVFRSFSPVAGDLTLESGLSSGTGPSGATDAERRENLLRIFSDSAEDVAVLFADADDASKFGRVPLLGTAAGSALGKLRVEPAQEKGIDYKLDLEQVQVRDVTVPEGEAPIALLHFTFEIA